MEQGPGSFPPPADDVEIDLREIFGALQRRRWVLAGCVLLITSAVLLVTFQLTPRYTANTEVLIDPRERNVVDLESVLSGLSSDASTIDSQIEVIGSRSLARRVVEQLGLARDPEFNVALREPGPLGAVVSWLRGLFPAGLEDETEEERQEREQFKVTDAFSEALHVSRVGRRSFVIEVSFTSENARKASRVANTLADLYLVEQLEAKFEATQRATDWLNERLGALRKRVEASEQLVEAYRAEHQLVDSDGITVDEQQVSEINAQLILARADLAETQARFRHVNDLLGSGSGVESVAEVLASEVVRDLRQQQAELAREQAELESRYGDRHPHMIKIRAQRQDLGFEVEAEVKRITANLANEVTVARSRSQSLHRSLEELQRQRSTGEVARIRLRELEREAAANRTLYESFLGRFKETSEQAGVAEADARIISAAAVPVDPSYPKKRLFAAVGLLLSLGVGLGAVFLLERLDNGFRTGTQLEAMLGLPHLASIPELSERDRSVEGKTLSPEDYVLAKPLSAYGEALRSLRAALLLSNVDAPPRVVVLTSALPSEGKTTMALSLGRASALSGARTVVVDADLRHPSLAKTLGLQPEAGLIETLAGQVSLEDVLIHDEASGLYVLPTATGAANSSDLLGSGSMQALLEKLKKDFSLVLVDSAPVLVVSDTRVLSQTCDKLVFIAQWEKTPRGAAAEAVHALRQFEVDIAGVVFSRLDLKRHARYGYGDSYSYYKNYSSYYDG
ncbi:MAG: polysaccharide biosynthesis tyrosine autokinase [Myxococcota bacterium]|nr:polysaccharide biosynthesis tyrosine autokinase [Myxococcota bacterium]MDP7433429.1 polysaccharide biosynthesis tyrosine autokinase [Myxococcota bacterium]MDP7570168.1 polysaccharide biosynthesis tyrosine autokinase [Myxococcota bacterium]HJO23094.1 polysaccharide biosynthesis tyrosine autokinase [Myxococcota bacterium]